MTTDEATRIMKSQMQELEEEQYDCMKLMKEIETEEEYQYQSNLSSIRQLEGARESWYGDVEIQVQLEEIQAKHSANIRQIHYMGEERYEYSKRQQAKWVEREKEIRQEYAKRLEETNE